MAPPGFGPDPSWHPPVSPFHLVEEFLYSDPWRLLVACIFLNKTTAKVAVPVMDTYFSRWGSPEAASAACETELCELLKPMWLQRKRSQMLTRFSREYLGSWTSPARDLHGIGKYAEDAWRLFCCGDLSVQPTDKEHSELGSDLHSQNCPLYNKTNLTPDTREYKKIYFKELHVLGVHLPPVHIREGRLLLGSIHVRPQHPLCVRTVFHFQSAQLDLV